MRFAKEPAHSHDQPERTAVVLVNLGTPDAPTPAALRRYLAEFLSDPRVVEIPRLLWWLILHGVILRMRPPQSAAKYASHLDARRLAAVRCGRAPAGHAAAGLPRRAWPPQCWCAAPCATVSPRWPPRSTS